MIGRRRVHTFTVDEEPHVGLVGVLLELVESDEGHG